MAEGPKGRSMRKDPATPAAPARPPDPVPGPAADEPSPFASFGPSSGSMTASAEQNRAQSLGVLAIVGGGVFTVAAAIVVALVVILLYLGYRTVQREVASTDPKKDQHVRDSGHLGPIDPGAPRPPPRPHPVGDPGGDDTRGGQGSGIPPGPATVVVPNTMVFLSIEVNCPGGYRARGSFRGDTDTTMRATVPTVPGDERCTVTFQGSEPAKTWISGNQTKYCTFNPVVCRDI